jgi:hypothetical protein
MATNLSSTSSYALFLISIVSILDQYLICEILMTGFCFAKKKK